MFTRRVSVKGKAGKSYTYVRAVSNEQHRGVSRQQILIDFGSEKRFPRVLSALARFLGPCEWLRAITDDELLVKLATKWDRLDEVARSMVRGILAEIDEERASRSEEEMIEQLRDEIDGELRGDDHDDAPGTALRAAKAAR